jgi:hypothetical protein
MAKIAIMLAVTILVALGAIMWTKSTVSATVPLAGPGMSGVGMHIETGSKNMPMSDIAGLV